jgi:hypothetical protein
MSGAANQGPYANPGAPYSPWGPGAAWGHPYPGYWHWRAIPKPLLIAGMVLGFIFWWPVGLAVLFFMFWSKRMGCWEYGPPTGQQGGGWQGRGAPWANWRSWGCGGGNGNRTQRTSGNRAFDEYRSETLNRLEEEQREFAAFLDRLRFAKDKSEFDAFMTERRQPKPPQETPPQG